MNIKHHMDEITDLKADIHLLKYPMGEIDYMGHLGTRHYVYENKNYRLFGIERSNITGYRKQGDYIQIRWIEDIEGVEVIIHADTFLLKDELIPLEGCTVEFDCEFVEVGDDT